jgi:hypothetical protein
VLLLRWNSHSVRLRSPGKNSMSRLRPGVPKSLLFSLMDRVKALGLKLPNLSIGHGWLASCTIESKPGHNKQHVVFLGGFRCSISKIDAAVGSCAPSRTNNTPLLPVHEMKTCSSCRTLCFGIKSPEPTLFRSLHCLRKYALSMSWPASDSEPQKSAFAASMLALAARSKSTLRILWSGAVD